MDLYDLGAVTWWQSQCFYHALAHLGREGLIICYPSSPYICLGLHDDLEQEIDRAYCETSGIPLFRRETGGGVVYLDQRQVFFQLVLRRDNPRLPLRRYRYYERFLQPAITVYRQYGIPAELKPPADLAAAGKKCSGNGCGDIEQGVAFVGNLLLDFDFDIMSRVLKAPFPEFRRHLKQAMADNMTTFKDWVRVPAAMDELAARLIQAFSREWSDLRAVRPDQELQDKARELAQRYTSAAWLGLPGRRYVDRKVKIAEGLMLLEKSIKAGGKAAVLVRNGTIEAISVPGYDYPVSSLIGKTWEENLPDLIAAGATDEQGEIIYAG
ncbi:MAG TPA: lipoate--protein ligase family protein [Syntrophomonas sp.]|nr:lipoate--protein ligase family protein [Syntrophomonas sp.]